jgi:hypothetical protein
MGNITNAEERRLLDNSLGTSPAANRYVALLTSNPGETGSLSSEISTSGTGYARQLVSFNAASTTADVTTATNDGDITFPVATADWASGDPITHIAIVSSASGAGDVFWYGEATASKIVLVNDQLIIRDEQLVISLD